MIKNTLLIIAAFVAIFISSCNKCNYHYGYKCQYRNTAILEFINYTDTELTIDVTWNYLEDAYEFSGTDNFEVNINPGSSIAMQVQVGNGTIGVIGGIYNYTNFYIFTDQCYKSTYSIQYDTVTGISQSHTYSPDNVEF